MINDPLYFNLTRKKGNLRTIYIRNQHDCDGNTDLLSTTAVDRALARAASAVTAPSHPFRPLFRLIFLQESWRIPINLKPPCNGHNCEVLGLNEKRDQKASPVIFPFKKSRPHLPSQVSQSRFKLVMIPSWLELLHFDATNFFPI